MQGTISKWGNSLALRLPRHVAVSARLVEGATVKLEIGEDGSLRITPARKKFALSELLASEGQAPAGAKEPEVDWGAAEGDEAW